MATQRVIYVAILMLTLVPQIESAERAAAPRINRLVAVPVAEFTPRGASPFNSKTEDFSDTVIDRVKPAHPLRLETLEEAWAIAANVDHRLRSQEWQVSSAEQSLYAAEAGRLPNVSMESSYVGRSSEPSFTFDLPNLNLPTNQFPFAQRDSASFRAGVGVPLYTGGSISARVRAAEARIASETMGLAGSHNDLRLRVANAYVDVLRAQRATEVAEMTEKSLRAHAIDVKLLFRQKQVPRQDLLAADVALLNAQQHTIQTRNQLDFARAAYNRILVRPLTLQVRIAELPVTDGRYDVDHLTQRAIVTRPAVAQTAAKIEDLEYRAAALRGTRQPQVQLRGDYDFSENRYQSPQGIATIGVYVNWNVYDHGRVGREAETLQHQAESIRWQLRDLKSMITLEVRQAWLDIQETRRRLEVTPQACRQADENLRVARHRYTCGAAISTAVLDAQTQQIQAYTNHSNTIYDAVMAVIRLQHAVGAEL